MLFLQRILSPFNHSVLSKHALFSISKITDVESPNRLGAEAGEDCRKRDMIQFLRNDCGLSESQVVAIARRGEQLFKTKSIDRAQQAVQLFRDSGFTEDQVRKIVFTQPHSLLYKVDTQLKPKLEFMRALGFTSSNLGHIVSRAPGLLTRNLEQDLSPKISLLVGEFGSMLNLCKIIMGYPRFLLFKIDTLKPKIDILKHSSMQDELLLYLIRLRPSLILGSEDMLKLNIECVRNLGVLEGSKAFANALAAVHSSGLENFENKLKLLATLGLLENEILQIVGRLPSALTFGIDKLKKNMDFLKNRAGFQANIVVSRPFSLSYSVENRLRPRHKVIEFLKETDPSRLPKSLVTVYGLSDQLFADKFLMGSPEARKLFDKYKGKSNDLPSPERFLLRMEQAKGFY